MIREILEERKIPKKNNGGECYTKAYNYFMDNYSHNSNLRLVHGLVTGQGPIEGIRYNHAWCEDGDQIIDMTQKPEVQKSIPKPLYYAIGNIEEKTTFRYSYKAILNKINEYKTYGPWGKGSYKK